MKAKSKLFSKHILKQTVSQNWKWWVLFTGVITLITVLVTIAVGTRDVMVHPVTGEVIQTSVISIYQNVFLGTVSPGIFLMLIYIILIGNKLIASEVDSGILSITLNTPITRAQIVFSKALFYILSLVSLVLVLGVVSMIATTALGLELDVIKLWLMLLALFIYVFAVSGICFFASCWFNKSGQSLTIGAGLPVTFLLLKMLADMLAELEFLKYFSINTLINTTSIIAGTNTFLIGLSVLTVLGVALYTIGIIKFLKKDLPL